MPHAPKISEKTAMGGDSTKNPRGRTMAILRRKLGKRPKKVKGRGIFPKKRGLSSSRARAFAGK
jgi:hypothetical protein